MFLKHQVPDFEYPGSYQQFFNGGLSICGG